MHEASRNRQQSRRRVRASAAGALAAVGLAGAAGATPPVGSQTRVSVTGTDGDAAFAGQAAVTAYNPRADQHLVVWQGETTVDGEDEIHGRLVRADGTPAGDQFRITNVGPDGDAAHDAASPAVAYNRRSDEYLVVYEGTATAGADQETEVYAQRLSSAGARVGSPVRVSDMGPDGNGAFDALDPAVAYSPASNEYMVVWEGDDDTAPLVDGETEIFGQRLDAAATPVGTNDARLSDMGPDADPAYAARNPAIAASTAGEYLVVWEGDDNTAPLVGDEVEVFGQRLSAAGAQVGANDARLSDMGPDGSTSFAATDPAVTYNGRANQYLVVWAGDDNTAPLVDGEVEVFGQRLTAAGAQVGTNDARLSDMGPDGDASFDAATPSVAANFRANEYLVVWAGDDNTAPLVDEEGEVFGQRVDGTGAETGTNDARISAMGADGNAAFDALAPGVGYGSAANEYLVAWHGDTGVAPLADDELEVHARRAAGGSVPTPTTPSCRTVAEPSAPKGDPSRVRLTRSQLLTNQRISQAAVRRANAIQEWLEAGITARDLCGGAVDRAEFGPGVTVGFLPASTPPVVATPRSITPRPTGGGTTARVRLSRSQLLINQRISQAAVLRANALKARLDAGLTGGDVKDGSLTANTLVFGLGILAAAPGASPAAKTTTVITRPLYGTPGRVHLSRSQLLINQRISQAAVRRTNALRARLQRGLAGSDLRDGTLSAVDLAAAL
ncbi:MAG: hypothetical protein AB1416_07820, partial [Actinomycetota bacterium]